MENRRKNGVSEAIRMAAVTHRLLTAGTVLCAAASVAASLVPPMLLARIIDGLTAGLPLTFPAVLLYFGSLALEGMLSSAQESLLVLFGQKMTHALRSEMSRKLTKLPASTLAGQNPGEVAARFSGDVDTVEALFTSGIISMVADACRILSIMAVIAVKNTGLALILLLVLPLFVLERKSLWQSVKESFCCIRRRVFRAFLLLLRWNLSVVLRSLLLTAAVAVPLYGIIIAVGLQSTQAMFALSRAALAIEMPFFQFLIDCAITMAQCTILAMLHCRLRESLPSEPEPVQSGKYHRSTGRLLLGASVAGATLLTFALAFCYLALPRDDELLSMLGGVAPVVTAHRGYSAAAPENTLPAFQLAIDQGCEWAELDVQMTRDGVVMVTHDTSLRRCTGRNENIYDLTYNEVRKLDAGRWFGQKYTGAKVPTLEEVLDLCKGKIQLNIEIKPNAATPELEAETIRIIREKGFAQDCTITSQSYETLCKVKELAPEIRTGYILALGVGSYYDLPAADFFSVQSTFITSGMVQQIHKRSKTISAWTVNREEDASELLSIGVDDLITDKPDMIQQLLSEDADLDNSLVLLRDFIRDLFAPSDVDEPTPEEETIEEAIEDPDELLDAS